MSVLIFRLNGVPDDEAVEVRALPDEHGFDYHETTGGFLGIGVAGLWLIDADQKAAAGGNPVRTPHHLHLIPGAERNRRV